MGGSSSTNTIRNENNTTIVNKSSMDILNKQVTDVSSSVAVDAAQSCSSKTKATNMIDFSNAAIAGDFNIGASSNPNEKCATELKQSVAVSFSCTNENDVTQNMGQEMMKKLANTLSSKVDNDLLNKVATDAASQSTAGAIAPPWGGSDSSNDVTNINNT